MVDIKYRIWDYDLKRFIEKEFEFLINSKGELFIFRNDKLTFFDKEPYEIMQCTEVKDNNGKEIYVGDILEYRYVHDRRIKMIFPVILLKGKASFGVLDLYGNEVPLYEVTARCSKIIGNIYENPELINKKN